MERREMCAEAFGLGGANVGGSGGGKDPCRVNRPFITAWLLGRLSDFGRGGGSGSASAPAVALSSAWAFFASSRSKTESIRRRRCVTVFRRRSSFTSSRLSTFAGGPGGGGGDGDGGAPAEEEEEAAEEGGGRPGGGRAGGFAVRVPFCVAGGCPGGAPGGGRWLTRLATALAAAEPAAAKTGFTPGGGRDGGGGPEGGGPDGVDFPRAVLEGGGPGGGPGGGGMPPLTPPSVESVRFGVFAVVDRPNQISSVKRCSTFLLRTASHTRRSHSTVHNTTLSRSPATPQRSLGTNDSQSVTAGERWGVTL